MSLERHTAALDRVLQQAPVVPVIVINELSDAVPLARALVAGGLPVLEITLRTPVALDAIRAINAEVDGAIAGAGTVLTPADLAAVHAAGGAFAISPGCTPALYDAAAAGDLPHLPGAATASELMEGIARGCTRFKFFPAEAAGGVTALKAFAGPLPAVKFCPTGGIDAARAPAYLALPNVMTVGGSWMLPADAVKARDWARIEQLAREAAALRAAG